MPARPDPIASAPQNQLLAGVSAAQWAQWRPYLERVDVARGDVLCEAGRAPAHAFFPTTAVVSWMVGTQDGASSEIAVVGGEGMVGVCLCMGGQAVPHQAVVQSAGQGYRLRAQALKTELRGATLQLLLRYAHTLLAQFAQTAACNRYHSIDQRLSRRLLLGLDRSSTPEIDMTQETAAALLGVRREGITVAAQKLQLAGVIRYHRGHIVVTDRQRLQQRTCGCYAAAGTEQQRLLPVPLAA